ncbi:MAG TPA: transcriptional regulator [Alphaproteobacteria bacterium]|nr:transcriptional regulator [Alphaproteobacteria bacterium]HAJ45918.1 transcriptional regulator [Alphaproteobacteria bacterium]
MDDVTYVKDEDGKAVAVIVPIRKWRELLDEQHEDAVLVKRAKKVDRSLSIPLAYAQRDLAGENRIKVYREMRGLTRAALAAKVGSTTAHISQLETSVREGGKATLRKIAKALDLPLSVLVD